jgi:hypothetical protein
MTVAKAAKLLGFDNQEVLPGLDMEWTWSGRSNWTILHHFFCGLNVNQNLDVQKGSKIKVFPTKNILEFITKNKVSPTKKRDCTIRIRVYQSTFRTLQSKSSLCKKWIQLKL